MLNMKTTTSPTLSSGAVAVSFGQFAKVKSAMAQQALSANISGYTLQVTTLISSNVVRVTETWGTTLGSGDFVAVQTADVSGQVLTVIADGE